MKIPLARSLRQATSAIFDVVRSLFGSAKGLQDVNLNRDGLTTAVRASQVVGETWARLTPDNVETLAILLRRGSSCSLCCYGHCCKFAGALAYI